MAEILCAAKNTDFKGFAMNPEYDRLPDEIKDKLRILCAEFVEDAGGVFIIQFEEDGTPQFVTEETVDEIGAGVRISKLQREEARLWEQLRMFYRVFVLGEDAASLLEKGDV